MNKTTKKKEQVSNRQYKKNPSKSYVSERRKKPYDSATQCFPSFDPFRIGFQHNVYDQQLIVCDANFTQLHSLSI